MERVNSNQKKGNSGASTLKQRIMRKVYRAFMLRNLAPLAFDIALLVGAAFLVTVFVSVRDVLSNFGTAASGGSYVRFSIAAVSGTKLQTKLLLLFLGVIGFFAVRHLRRAVAAWRVMQGKTQAKKPPVRDVARPSGSD